MAAIWIKKKCLHLAATEAYTLLVLLLNECQQNEINSTYFLETKLFIELKFAIWGVHTLHLTFVNIFIKFQKTVCSVSQR